MRGFLTLAVLWSFGFSIFYEPLRGLENLFSLMMMGTYETIRNISIRYLRANCYCNVKIFSKVLF